MSVFSSEKPLDLNRILERSGGFQKPISHSHKSTALGSVVHVWKIAKVGENVVVEALKLSPAQELEDSSCYIILHTYGEIPRSETLVSFNSFASFCADAMKVCAPKGLQSRVTDSSSYDLYQWIGLKAKPEIKSIALGKTYQLNTSLSAIIARVDTPLHSYLVRDMKLVPFTISSEPSPPTSEVTRANHLLARVTTQLFGKENTHVRKQSILSAGLSNLVTPRSITLVKKDDGWKACLDGGAPQLLTERKKSIFSNLNSARNLFAELALTPKSSSRTGAASGLSLDIVQVLEGIEDGAIEPDDMQRKQRKLDYFGKLCSVIVPDKFYLASNVVAQDKNLLLKTGITHIVNTAGVICPNHFQNENLFTYMTLYLADGPHEDISSVFYDCFDFIKKALENPNNKVLVHCFQGVSRSATIVFAYLMLQYSWGYEKIYTHVREKRPIVEPNTGFMIQLRTFEKRLKSGVENPRLYELTLHRPEDPSYFVPKVVKNPTKPPKSIYLSVNSLSIHPNTNFVLHDVSGKIYIWKGNKSSEHSEAAAVRFSNFLKEYEKGTEIITLKQGDECPEFWNIFEDQGQAFLAKDFTTESNDGNNNNNTKNSETNIEKTEEKDEEELVPCMYQWPTGEKIEMFDSDDLDEDSAFLVFDKNSKTHQAFLWVGEDCELSEKPREEVIAIGNELLKKIGIEGNKNLQVVGDSFDDCEQDFWDLFVC
eukprot:c15415_g1_i1.p1 GENE.c15415_g1_i1~~c15415_g1_i1.p1  ORF type:complete len:710 (+),score=295.18 c15415_g1_i1:38-2167(+)